MCVVCKKPFQPNEPILVLPCGDGDETTKVSYQEWQHMNRNVLPSGKVHAVHLHCCPAGSSAEAPPWWESDQYQTPDDESIKVFCPCCANGAHKLRLDVLENIAKDQKENAARRGDNLFFYEDFVPRNLWQRLRGKGRVDFKSTPATAAAAVSLSVTGFCRDCDKDITRSDHVAIMSCLDQEAADDWRKTGTHYLPAKGVAALHLECAKKLVEDPEAKCPICGHSVLFRHKDAETLRNKKPQAHQLTYVVHQTPGCCCCF
jgi:hypothetical protein